LSATTLRVLLVEDVESDAALLVRSLRQGGYDVHHERVQTVGEMRAALRGHPWDVVVSDYRLPQFDAPSALEILKETGLDIPFIVVSGTIGEETAVSMMKAGANDYLMKDNLTRLAPAVERELREARSRRQRRQAEEALRASEERFRAVFDATVDGILVADRESGALVMANGALCHMLGGSEAELLRLGLRDIHAPEELPAVIVSLRDRVADGAAVARNVSMTRRDGAPFVADVSVVPVVIDGRDCLLGVYRDMSALREMEAQMRQAQKIEAIGRLAGGVAHDFNKILGVILGHTELGLRSLRDDGPLRANPDQIRASAEKAAALTRQLLVFSRKEPLETRALDLNAIVRNLGRMLDRLIGDDVELRVSLGSNLGAIVADPGQIEQVVINLAVNARDAMPDGGRITIATWEEDVTGSPDCAGFDGPAACVVLSVADTGCGMDDTVRQHIFEPFFTTKDAGKGTGLGLSTVYGIVQQAGGCVAVESEVNRGTTFRVYLPRSSDKPEPSFSKESHAPTLGRGETVLVVEDSASLRDVVRDILERPVVAVNGGEALLLVEETGLRPDLLITDVVMPGINGAVLADRLRKILPGLKVLFMSGYPDLGASATVILPCAAHCFSSPSPRTVSGARSRTFSGEGRSRPGPWSPCSQLPDPRSERA
jgi:two-component system cell cycle sensor histidine kinase/response regulator CckA